MPVIKWENLLATVFSSDGKTSMKADKAVKRAVKLALSNSTNEGTSKKEIKKKLQASLSSGNVPGYKLDDERIMKVALPVYPPAPTADKKKKKEKEKKKKRKRRSSSGNDTDDDANDKPASTTNETPREKDSKKKKKKKQKVSNGQENESPPATTPATTQPAAATNAITASAPTTNVNNTNNNTQNNNNNNENENNGDLAWRESLKRTDIKNGRFSTTELDTIRTGVQSFAQARGLSTDDYSWIFAGKGQRSSDILGLWKHVAQALPRRTIKSVAAAGNRLFHPDAKKGKWTPEEDEELRFLVSERGNKWVQIGAQLGRDREACRVRYREIQLGSEKKTGEWSTDEVERLESAVNEYLQAKKDAEGGRNTGTGSGVPTIVAIPASGGASGGGAAGPSSSTPTPGRGVDGIISSATTTNTTPGSTSQNITKRIVLDDIDWGVISQRVRTRSNIQCLEKWYKQVAPSMIDRGEWGEGDDRRLLRSLWRAGNVAEFEVGWDSLVPGRTAQQARRRWRLMIKVVSEYKEMEFSELVEFLVKKYMPQLVEREPRGGVQAAA